MFMIYVDTRFMIFAVHGKKLMFLVVLDLKVECDLPSRIVMCIFLAQMSQYFLTLDTNDIICLSLIKRGKPKF